MIRHELRRESGIPILAPEGALEADDFRRIAAEVDPYIAENGRLAGVMIYAESFRGWHDFAALVSHLRFVRDHHRRIARVAAVSDGGFLTIMPGIARHFVQADVRHFPYGEREAALAWLASKPAA